MVLAVLLLHVLNAEMVQWSDVACVELMGMYGWSCLKALSEPFPKGFCLLPYVLFITFQSIALIPVNYSSFLLYTFFILASYKDVFKSSVFFEMCMHAILFADIFNTLT